LPNNEQGNTQTVIGKFEQSWGGRASSVLLDEAPAAGTPNRRQSLSAGVLDETATGVVSFPRGVYRGLRQEARRAGFLGGGQQIQAIYIEDAIIGEVLTVIAENPELSARIGLKVLKHDYARVMGRLGAGAAATTVLRKKVAGGIAGVGMGLSLGVLAAGGDVRTVAENLALDQKIFVTTVDPTSAILPQIGRQRADAIVEGVTAAIEALLTGDSRP
jgi:hypothetical protein